MPAAPGTMIYSILDRIIQFFQEEKNRERIKSQCIDPLLRHILDKMFPYIILTCIIFSLILLMSLTTVSLLVFQMRQPIIETIAAVPITNIIQPPL